MVRNKSRNIDKIYRIHPHGIPFDNIESNDFIMNHTARQGIHLGWKDGSVIDEFIDYTETLKELNKLVEPGHGKIEMTGAKIKTQNGVKFIDWKQAGTWRRLEIPPYLFERPNYKKAMDIAEDIHNTIFTKICRYLGYEQYTNGTPNPENAVVNDQVHYWLGKNWSQFIWEHRIAFKKEFTFDNKQQMMTFVRRLNFDRSRQCMKFWLD